MKHLVARLLPGLAWVLGIGVITLSVIVWGEGLRWQLGRLTPYSAFPLFGLVAFSLMWTHYIILALRVYTDAPPVTRYSQVTQWLVLVALLAHPMIFHHALLTDGLGLPPESYAAYVGESLVGVVLLGTVAWLAFIAYEAKRWFASQPWWRFVLGANAVAMVLVYVHAQILGTHLQGNSWFVAVWYGYGITLGVAFWYLLKHGRLTASADPKQAKKEVA